MRFALACQRANLGFLVQLRSLSLDLLLVIPIQALDVVYGGLQILHRDAALHLCTTRASLSCNSSV